ncbi:MAG: hypothetical protein ABH952_02960 [Candidatus Omnitrophota bacterium]
MKHNAFFRGIALGVIFGLIFSNPVLAVNMGAVSAPAAASMSKDITEFSIPRSWGRIKEIYEGTGDKFVIHIQDAHCNYEAQEKISKIVDRLAEVYGVNVIGLEGGAGRLNTFVLSTYPNAKVRQMVADYLLKNNEITGSEYAAAISNVPLKVYGIENMQLYVDNLAAFNTLDTSSKDILNYFSRIEGMFNQLKEHIYSRELLEIENKKADYEAAKIGFNDYCRYLASKLDKSNINKEEWLVFSTLLEALELEKNIDFDLAEQGKKNLISLLTNALPKGQLQTLVEMTIAFKNAHISSAAYCSYLKDLALEHNIAYEGFENFDRYIAYASLYDKIENGRLFDDIEALEETLKESLFVDAKERELSKLFKMLSILEKMVTLKMINKDMVYFTENRADFTDEAFMDFINNIAPQYGLDLDTSSMNTINQNITQWEQFYHAAAKRDDALVVNTLALLDKENVKTAAMIVGGYHTRAVTDILREKDVSYMVITPYITKNVKSEYMEMLKGKETILDKFNEFLPVGTMALIDNLLGREAREQLPEGVAITRGADLPTQIIQLTLAVATQEEGVSMSAGAQAWVNALAAYLQQPSTERPTEVAIPATNEAGEVVDFQTNIPQVAARLQAEGANIPGIKIVELSIVQGEAREPVGERIVLQIEGDKLQVFDATEGQTLITQARAKQAGRQPGEDARPSAVGNAPTLEAFTAMASRVLPTRTVTGQSTALAGAYKEKLRMFIENNPLTEEQNSLVGQLTQRLDRGESLSTSELLGLAPSVEASLGLHLLDQGLDFGQIEGEATRSEHYMVAGSEETRVDGVTNRHVALDRELFESAGETTQLALAHHEVVTLLVGGEKAPTPGAQNFAEAYEEHRNLKYTPLANALFTPDQATKQQVTQEVRSVITAKVDAHQGTVLTRIVAVTGMAEVVDSLSGMAPEHSMQQVFDLEGEQVPQPVRDTFGVNTARLTLAGDLFNPDRTQAGDFLARTSPENLRRFSTVVRNPETGAGRLVSIVEPSVSAGAMQTAQAIAADLNPVMANISSDTNQRAKAVLSIVAPSAQQKKDANVIVVNAKAIFTAAADQVTEGKVTGRVNAALSAEFKGALEQMSKRFKLELLVPQEMQDKNGNPILATEMLALLDINVNIFSGIRFEQDIVETVGSFDYGMLDNMYLEQYHPQSTVYIVPETDTGNIPRREGLYVISFSSETRPGTLLNMDVLIQQAAMQAVLGTAYQPTEPTQAIIATLLEMGYRLEDINAAFTTELQPTIVIDDMNNVLVTEKEVGSRA